MPERTLTQKLMIREGRKVLFVNPPQGYQAMLGRLPANVQVLTRPTAPIDVIQVFVASSKDLQARLPKLKAALGPRGVLWVTYHKGTSRVKTDINRDTIRDYARTLGLEAVAIISVDNDWSALRLKPA